MENTKSTKRRRFLSVALTLMMTMGLSLAMPLEARAATFSLTNDSLGGGSGEETINGNTATWTENGTTLHFETTGQGTSGLAGDGLLGVAGSYTYLGYDGWSVTNTDYDFPSTLEVTVSVPGRVFDLSSMQLDWFFSGTGHYTITTSKGGTVTTDLTLANSPANLSFSSLAPQYQLFQGIEWFKISVTAQDSANYAAISFCNLVLDNITQVYTPSVTAVSPNRGTTAGGTSVTIVGAGFGSVSAVEFGATTATYIINSTTQITATAPAGSAGVVDVTVRNLAGTSAIGDGSKFTYVAPPTVNTPTTVAYTDTAVNDIFSNTIGNISATTGGIIVAYGISGGTADGSDEFDGQTYDISKVGSYGTLYISSGAGDYVFVPNKDAINGVSSNQSETFTVTVTDNYGGIGSATLTVNITGAYDTPTDISLSNSEILENAGINAVVGSLSSTDIDLGDSFTYSLVGGVGDTNNAMFNISGANLRANESLTSGSYSVRIRTTDSGGQTYEKAFAITVEDVNDPPTLTATPSNPSFTVGGSPVLLFSDAAVSAVEAGQMMKELGLTVSNLMDGVSEILTIDGSNVALTNGNAGTSGNGFAYAVSTSGGTATVTISKSGDFSQSAAQDLINGLTYRNSSSNPTMGNRVVTLTRIQDNGGTANGGVDFTTLNISSAVTMVAVAPGAPTAVTATAGNAAASVSFTAPASNGGAAITSYTVTSSPGGLTGTGTASPITVTGLTNGTAYTFTVTATNTVATGVASTASNSVTPKAPQTITFTNPGAQNFGTAPTLVASSTSGLTPTFTSSTPGVCTITSDGILTFISAGSATINADQPGDASYLPAPTATQTFTVNAVAPGAPTAVTATEGDTQASVSFTAPASTGGTTITSYTVTVNPADVAPVNGSESPIMVTGLTNGQAYTFTVTANNVAGPGPGSSASNSVTPRAIQTITFANPGAQNFGTTPTLTATTDSGLNPTFTSSTPLVCTITGGGVLTFISAGTATINADQAGNASYLPATQVSRTFTVNAVAPGAPTGVTATVSDTTASVSFTAPVSNGGAAITGYTVTSSPGGLTGSGATSPITVSGLTPGHAYTFTVKATNSAATGAASVASNSVTLKAPQTIIFTNPGDQNFGTTPTLWAMASSGLDVTFTSTTPSVCTITHDGVLTFVGTGTATIIAEQAGDSDYLPATAASQSFEVNPVVPGAPTIGTATAGNGQATVSFTAPASNGGATITGYTVTSNPGGKTATGSTSPITVTGLTNGTAYTFTVAATNSVDTGAPSAQSNSITPIAPSTGGGGGGGSSSSTTAQTYKAEVKVENGNATLPVVIDKNTGSASVDASAQSNVMSEGKSAVITVPSIPNVDSYTIGIPVPNLSATDTLGSLTIHAEKGTITVPSNMLAGVAGEGGNKAQITIGEGDKGSLPDDVKAVIGDRPLIQLTLSVDGNQTHWNNPAAPVTVAIPYKPTAAELKNPEGIVVWYIDGKGNVVTIPNGRYDGATGKVTFATTHFSDYAVAYNPVSFNDVAADAWYHKAVTFIAARGITTGTGDGNFSPQAKLTRGEFIVLMMKAYGIAPDTNAKDNFADGGNTYYTGYLAKAKQLEITSGIGNNMYAPNKEITRQEMFTLLYNALKAIDQLPQGNAGKALSDFTDGEQIDKWAVDAMTFFVKTNTVGGNGGKLTPTGTTTRGEMVQVLYNLLGK